MEQLIRITENNGQKAVSARELYENLGYAENQFARWAKKNIISNEFALEGTDFIRFVHDIKGDIHDINVENSDEVHDIKDELSNDLTENIRRGENIVLSLDFAKRLAMLARTEAGEKIRRYFVEVEKQAIRQSNTALLYKMQEVEKQIDIQTEIRNKANEELRFLNKLLRNTKTEIYGQLPPKAELSNCVQMELDFNPEFQLSE